MDCSDFVGRYTEFADGSAPDSTAAAIQAHLEQCPSCRRYRAVLERGVSLVRALPEPELGEDFEPRLQHRLFHVDDERLLSRATSGTSAFAVLGIAVVLTAAAWWPTLRASAPVVELEPIVVDRAPTRLPARPTAASADGSLRVEGLTDLDRGLWDDAYLYDYSPLSQRYDRPASLRRVGFDER